MLTLKSLLDVDCLFCARLEIWDTAFGLAESHGALR
jgi:hypothetical protein